MKLASGKVQTQGYGNGENRSGYKPPPLKNYVPPAPVKVPPPTKSK